MAALGAKLLFVYDCELVVLFILFSWMFWFHIVD